MCAAAFEGYGVKAVINSNGCGEKTEGIDNQNTNRTLRNRNKET